MAMPVTAIRTGGLAVSIVNPTGSIAGLEYATRADLVTAVSGGFTMENGMTVKAVGLEYKWQSGATVISDLPGLVPVEPVVPDHFGGGLEGIAAAIAAGYPLTLPDGDYELQSEDGAYFNGYIQVENGTHIKGSPDAVLKQKSYSLTLDPSDTTPPIAQGSRGAFISNAAGFSPNANGSSAESIVTDIVLENVHIDGTDYPAISQFVLGNQGGTASTTTFVLPSGASSVDDFYNGWTLQFMDGSAASGTVELVTDYVGSTKTITCTTLAGTPASGNTVNLGYNDLGFGFANGATNIRLVNPIVRNYPDLDHVPYVTGAKGINFEQGVYSASVQGGYFENVGCAFFVQGKDGTHVNTALKQANNIRSNGFHAKTCGSVAVFLGDDADNDAAEDMSVIVSDVTYQNCGHRPHRIVNSDQQKSGVFVFGGSNSIQLRGIVGYNESTYPNTSPGYPTDWASKVGYGLSGNVGALFWGFGRHISIRDVKHSGDLDTVFHFGRARATGNDGGNGASSAILSCKNWQARVIDVHGAVTNILRLDGTSTFRPANSLLTGYLEVTVTSVTAIVHADAAAYTNIILDVTERGTGKRVIGTPKQIYDAGNTFASFASVSRALLIDLRLSNQVRQIANSGAKISNTGNTNENTLVSVAIPANSLGPNGFIRVWTTWTTTANTNTKQIRVKMGGTNFMALNVNAGTAVSAQCVTLIRNRNATNSQISHNTAGTTGGSSVANVTAAVDTTADQTLTITAQCATSGADTIDLEGYTVEACYAP